MPADPTEDIRRTEIALGGPQAELALAEAGEGPVWTTEELRRDFRVTGFLAPYVCVVRLSDGVKGILEFAGGFGSTGERRYFNWSAD